MIGADTLNHIHSALVMKRRVRVLARSVAEAIETGGSVLDVGCGDGTLAKTIETMRPDLTFSGVDVLMRPSVAIPARLYDGVTIPHPDRSFDYAMIIDVLHHTDDPAGTIRECLRISRRGVVIKDHLASGLASRAILRFMDWVGNRGHGVRLPYNYLPREEWERVFGDLDCDVVHWKEDIGLYPRPFSLVFERNLHFIARLQKDARSSSALPEHASNGGPAASAELRERHGMR
jgi:SAM-dependent methyltransferase